MRSHFLAGGVIAGLQGGKFGHGFWSAGLTKAASVNEIVGTEQGAGWDLTRVATAAAIGGTISEVTGGKFANGASTAAFAQAFNGNTQARKAQRQKKYRIYLVAKKSVLNGGSHVGHTFIGGVEPDGSSEAWGFYPNENNNMIQVALEGVGSGVIQSDKLDFSLARMGDSQFEMMEFSVDQTTYESAMTYMATYDKRFDYGLISNNCTTAALRALEYAGIASTNNGVPSISPDGVADGIK